jgi:adenosylmethionine-8-amino-7-oxononanoate aminotransferase
MHLDKDAYAFIPRPGAVPLAIRRAEGVWLHTDSGQRILDAAGGAIVSTVGHGRAEVAEAMAEAVRNEAYVVPVFATESRLRLVERLRESWLPEGMHRIFLTSGGSESVDSAIRLARQHFAARGEDARHKIVGRDLSYHGATVTTLAAGGSTKRRKHLLPMLGETPKAPACYCLRCPMGKKRESCEIECANAVADVIDAEGAESVAAFVAEPIPGSTAGVLVPPTDYWPRVQAICRERGVLLIADEVMSGFGRSGRRFASEHFGLEPDILVGGKGLTGGYAPMGGVYTRDEIVAPLAEQGQDLMFFTFGAHPAACAAADKVLEIMEREKLVERSARMGALLLEKLDVLRDHPNVAEVRGIGLWTAVELVRDKEALESWPADVDFTARVVAAGLGEGVFFYPGGSGSAKDVVLMGPAFTIAEPELDLMVGALGRAIDSAAARG